MIVVDANILLYAEDSLSPVHERARKWWDAQLSDSGPVGLCWPVLLAFLRIGTNPRVFERPLSIEAAVDRIQSWLEQPCTQLIYPTASHWQILRTLILDGQAAGNLISDAHLAALAIEYNGILYSTDADFSRFPKLKWKNPIA